MQAPYLGQSFGAARDHVCELPPHDFRRTAFHPTFGMKLSHRALKREGGAGSGPSELVLQQVATVHDRLGQV